MSVRVILSALCLMSFSSQGRPALEGDLDTAIAKELPGYEVFSVSQGALTDGPERYAVTLLFRQAGVEHEFLAAVFVRLGPASYQLAAKSPSWEHYLHHRRGWGAEIRNKAVVLFFGGSTSCCSHDDTEFRFKLLGERFALVGSEITGWGVLDNSGPGSNYEFRRSVNFLTGKVIHSLRTGVPAGEKRAIDRKKRNRYIEAELPFINPTAWELANFHPDRFYDFDRNTPALCGAIDERKKKYVPCKPE